MVGWIAVPYLQGVDLRFLSFRLKGNHLVLAMVRKVWFKFYYPPLDSL